MKSLECMGIKRTLSLRLRPACFAIRNIQSEKEIIEIEERYTLAWSRK